MGTSSNSSSCLRLPRAEDDCYCDCFYLDSAVAHGWCNMMGWCKGNGPQLTVTVLLYLALQEELQIERDLPFVEDGGVHLKHLRLEVVEDLRSEATSAEA